MARAAHCTIVVASKGQTLEEANEAYAKHYAIAELEKFVSVIDRKTEFYDGAQGYWTGYLDGLADIKREYLETIDRLRGEEAS
jgi:LmbE family N-acetylglucosaminyl deacetylase